MEKSLRNVSLGIIWVCNTGRFIMFFVITNIYNKKTKGTTLMEKFKITGKLKKFIFDNEKCSMCAPRWHGTHRYDIKVLATHASIWVHRYSSLLQWSVLLGQRGHVAMVRRIPGLLTYPQRKKITGCNARCTVTTELLVWYSNTQNDFSLRAAIFSLHTLASPSGRNVN
jgi:hypothetical protein